MGSRKLPRTQPLSTLLGKSLRTALGVLLALLMPTTHAASIADLLSPPANEARILAVEDAFQPQPALWRDGRLTIGVDIAPGCYLYRDRFKVEVVEPAAYVLGAANLPAGEAYRDDYLGEVRILRNRLTVSFKPGSRTPPKQIRIRYQGCAEGLVCYPPQTRVLTVGTVR